MGNACCAIQYVWTCHAQPRSGEALLGRIGPGTSLPPLQPARKTAPHPTQSPPSGVTLSAISLPVHP
jgi:hypothetical protein